jgi:hypothetical protein
VKLPWTLQVFAVSAQGSESSPQRRLLLWVTVVLSSVWFTGTAFIVRAMTREARVAQLQSDFVAAVSHEFRSPLSSLCRSGMPPGPPHSMTCAITDGILARESERPRRPSKGSTSADRRGAAHTSNRLHEF